MVDPHNSNSSPEKQYANGPQNSAPSVTPQQVSSLTLLQTCTQRLWIGAYHYAGVRETELRAKQAVQAEVVVSCAAENPRGRKNTRVEVCR